MGRKISVSVALAITIIAMTVTFSITWLVSMRVFDNTVSAVTQLQAQYSKLAEIDNYVRSNYYGEIDDDYLFDRVAVGYMNGLSDRYSVYYSESEYNEMLEIENGTLTGIGLEVIRLANGDYSIVRVYDDSPAARAGVLAGGTLVTIGSEEAKSYTSTAAVQRALRGHGGEEVELVCRYNLTEVESFTVQHIDNYAPPTVQSIAVNGYGYIRISAFTANTYAEFDYELRQMQNQEVKGLVFDLRGTAGGYFRNSYDIIDALCPRGTIAKRVTKAGAIQVVATSDENFVDLPMVVLVNEATSGPAELFAASVRDLAGAQVAGTRTSGRGTLQSAPQRLADGSAVVVTTALLQTGKDESFNGVGVLPNVELESEGVNEQMLLVPAPDSDPQILRAIEVARSMVREAGGDPGPAMVTPGGDSSSSVPDDSSSDDPSDTSDTSDTSGTDDSGTDDSSATGDGDDSGSDSSSSSSSSSGG